MIFPGMIFPRILGFALLKPSYYLCQLRVSDLPAAPVKIRGAAFGDGIGALGRAVEPRFDEAPRVFECGVVGVRGDADRLADGDGETAERQIEHRAVPAAQLDVAAGRRR